MGKRTVYSKKAKTKPPIWLPIAGTMIFHRRMDNGAWDAYTDRPGGEMTHAEWIEYCQILSGQSAA